MKYIDAFVSWGTCSEISNLDAGVRCRYVLFNAAVLWIPIYDIRGTSATSITRRTETSPVTNTAAVGPALKPIDRNG